MRASYLPLFHAMETRITWSLSDHFRCRCQWFLRFPLFGSCFVSIHWFVMELTGFYGSTSFEYLLVLLDFRMHYETVENELERTLSYICTTR